MTKVLGLPLLALALATTPLAVEQPVSSFSDSSVVLDTTVAGAVRQKSLSSGLRFVGNVSYEFAGTLAELKADQVQDSRTTGLSGEVRMVLWATLTSPVFGESINAFTLATHTLGTLSAGQSFFNIDSGSVAFTPPPNGTYFITMALQENVSGVWYYEDLFTFGSTQTWPRPLCSPNSSSLCLNGGRFRVSVNWRAPSQGTSGIGTAVPLSSDTGYFWFFNSSNVELVVKVLDGRTINGNFWVFYGALSNVQYDILVTDLTNGFSKTYSNPSGTLASVADTQFEGTAPGLTATPTRNPTSAPTPARTPTPQALNLSGSWTGTIASPTNPVCNATVSVFITQVGSNISGNFSLPGNSQGAFQGTLVGHQLNGALTAMTPSGCSGTGAASGTASSNSITVNVPQVTSANPSCSFCQQNVIRLTR